MALPTPRISRVQGSWTVWWGSGFTYCDTEAEALELLAIKTDEANAENARYAVVAQHVPLRMRADPRDIGVRHRASRGHR